MKQGLSLQVECVYTHTYKYHNHLQEMPKFNNTPSIQLKLIENDTECFSLKGYQLMCYTLYLDCSRKKSNILLGSQNFTY